MDAITLNALRCFDAVARQGTFQGAARQLHRTHPTVFAAVRNLERATGVTLIDRSGYRIALTPAGRALWQDARGLLSDVDAFTHKARQLARGEESELRVVVGDLCPTARTLSLLRSFFQDCPATLLHVHWDALAGPWERLTDGEADLILHHVDAADPALEAISLFDVRLIPCVAPGFLPFAVSAAAPDRMRPFVQCIIRDTARHSPSRSYFVVEGARVCTVADQMMKREMVLQGMGWGHLPDYLVRDDLRRRRLLALPPRQFPGGSVRIVAARRRDLRHGPVATRLWEFLREQAGAFEPAGLQRPARRRRG